MFNHNVSEKVIGGDTAIFIRSFTEEQIGNLVVCIISVAAEPVSGCFRIKLAGEVEIKVFIIIFLAIVVDGVGQPAATPVAPAQGACGAPAGSPVGGLEATTRA